MNDKVHGLTAENMERQLPSVLAGDDSTRALAESAAGELAKRPEEIGRLNIYSNSEALPEELLDILAYDFKIDWWSGDYTLEEKRRTFRDNWKVHRLLGTKAAVETAIQAVFPKAKVLEWWEYGGKPYHFRLEIDVTGEAISQEKVQRVLSLVDYYKSLRSVLEAQVYLTKFTSTLHVGGHFSSYRVTRLPVLEEE